ncbi:MAG TPA: efflux RND transporter permease subunit [Isosphaeraceae bacterium]|nr:efflux RND transporter permease subunit [Isosphaeraceae bacterium]
MSEHGAGEPRRHDFLNGIVHIFLDNNFSIILIVVSVLIGLAALLVTAREEDPQIVVPLADVMVSMPGYSAGQVEQLAATPLEKILYQIDGVEYVYSMARENQAIITVRFYVGQDRERSLVKLFKKINENQDIIPPGVTGWVVKPVEIDDVPVVTLTLTGADGQGYTLRRVGEEVVQRLSALPGVSRAYVVGGEPRTVRVDLDPERLQAYALGPLEVQQALQGANVTHPAGDFTRTDAVVRVEGGVAADRPERLGELVVGVFQDRPVFLKDVAVVRDGPDEAVSYVRHGWGPARGFEAPEGFPGTEIGGHDGSTASASPPNSGASRPAVTLAIAKQKGTNAVAVAEAVLEGAESLRRDVIPTGMELVVTRNSGLTADEKVNELVEGLWVAIVIVIALLTLSLGWREALIVAVAVPVVFGLTLGVNLLFGYTINRVTLFALILSLGLLVDDPIVDVENIARHFAMRRRATRDIVLEAVAEIRPPLISATLAVIVSFLPMFFITGMMGPYMAPMALNVPVAMLMSMVVAFTITPWLAYQVLHKKFAHGGPEGHDHGDGGDDVEAIRRTFLYRLFRPLMGPLIGSRWAALSFLLVIALLTAAASGLAALRVVPLKMLPYDNKNELLLVIDLDEGATLERANALVREVEAEVARVPEVTDYVSYVGLPSPIDFNGLVRHYYLRRMPHNAEVRVNLVGKKHRAAQSHAIALRLHDGLAALAERHHARLKVVELPPGPPVLASLVAEVSGRPDHSYDDLIAAAGTVARRLRAEPGVVDVDDTIEAPARKLVFVTDQEKAALNGVSVDEIGRTLQLVLSGGQAGTVRLAGERNPLRVELRLPRAVRSSRHDLAAIRVRGRTGQFTPLSELGRWEEARVDQTLYHKNLERVVYVTAETLGRTPAECVLDVSVDRRPDGTPAPDGTSGCGWVSGAEPRPLSGRTFVSNGGGVAWAVPEGIHVGFSGEGEWKITLDVFRDLGLAFAAAMVMIYVILVMQTGSFLIPLVVMLAIPLTVLGVMPGFWLLNALNGQVVAGYADPVLFTATAMIGMIALAGIVTRDAIILVDFIGQSLAKGRPLFDAIMESRVVRMRPILLTAGAAMLSSIPITLDPIFSGLAWSLIFGLFASTIFTLFVIPVTYWLLHSGNAVSGEGIESTPAA